MNPQHVFSIDMTDPITIAAAECAATIAPDRGGLVTSFKVRERELLYLDQQTFLDLSKNVRGGIPILFPSPGKLTDDRWQHEQRSGSMKQHGFARTRPWDVVSATGQNVILQLESDDETLAMYPWQFAATLEVSIAASRLRLTMLIENTGEYAMPFALGYHPYFAVTDKRRATLETDATRQFDSITQRTGAVGGFDLAAGELDVHLLDQKQRHMTLALGDGGRITVRASPDFAHWVIWTVPGKDYVCVEPWTAPGNALNSGERLLTLAAGRRHESFMEIEFAE